MNERLFQAILEITVLAATPLLLTALGELMAEKVGVLNVGLEGIMLMGAMAGFAVAVQAQNANVGMLGGALAGLLFVMVFAVPVVGFNTEQLLPGFGLWLLGLGLSAGFGKSYLSLPFTPSVSRIAIPFLSDIPVVGSSLFDRQWPFYVAIILTFVFALVITRTRHGLNVRAIGEDPNSADATGISVRGWRFFYVAMTGLLAGFSGAFLSLVVIGRWEQGVTAGRGWVALAIVIVSQWRSLWLIVTSFVFGALLVMGNIGQALGWPVPSEVLGMVPYLTTILFLILFSLRTIRTPGATSAPASLGAAFIRGSG